jgi:hypothetical protein
VAPRRRAPANANFVTNRMDVRGRCYPGHNTSSQRASMPLGKRPRLQARSPHPWELNNVGRRAHLSLGAAQPEGSQSLGRNSGRSSSSICT